MIRKDLINLNDKMHVLHVRLGITEKLQLVNVGTFCCDTTADTMEEASTKMLSNLVNILTVLVNRHVN